MKRPWPPCGAISGSKHRPVREHRRHGNRLSSTMVAADATTGGTGADPVVGEAPACTDPLPRSGVPGCRRERQIKGVLKQRGRSGEAVTSGDPADVLVHPSRPIVGGYVPDAEGVEIIRDRNVHSPL